MSKYGPKAHLGSSVINWAPYYKKAIGDVLNGTWTTGQSWWGVKEGAIDLVSLSDSVPAETKTKIEAIKSGLKDGSFVIWKGPISDSSGKDILKAGDTADDKFLHGINFYVKGVQGKLPS
jgi:basic membrane protein A